MCFFGLLEAPTDSSLGPLKRRDAGPDGPGWPFLYQVECRSVLHHSMNSPFPSALQAPLKLLVRGHTLLRIKSLNFSLYLITDFSSFLN